MDIQTLVTVKNFQVKVVQHTDLLEWTLIALADGPDVDFTEYASQVQVLTESELVEVELELSVSEGEEPHTLTATSLEGDVLGEWEV